MEAKNLFVGILGIGRNLREKEIGWKKSQSVCIDPYLS
jgi:hypothetical protein